MQTQISDFRLSQEDIDNLPLGLRAKLSASAGSSLDGSQVRIFVIKNQNNSFGPKLKKLFEMTVRIFNARSKAVTEKNIEKLVEVILAGEARPSVAEIEIERDNAAIRADYVRVVPTLNSAQVRERCDIKPRNKSEPASRWKREGRIFAIRNGGVDQFPSFQFASRSPKPIVREILRKLPSEMSAWQIALWFNSPNGWLDGMCPSEALDKRDEVLDAAHQESQEIIG